MSHFLSPYVMAPTRLWGVRNRTSSTLLASRLEIAADSASRKKGLLGRDRLEPGTGLVIAPCGGVHTFFMRFPIDILFVARDGRVVKVCHAVKPWRVTLAPSAFCVIELPAETTRNARVGHYLELVAYEATAREEDSAAR